MVDGIQSPSLTMISTTKTELAELTNADLSWKTVTKGFRSANRRPRRINGCLNIGLQHNDDESKDEPSVAESEEFGVAVLGNRFSEKIDHLPIKKRRPMQQSLPIQPGALDGFVPEQTINRSEKLIVNKQPPCSEDSYGIELLAAIACNSRINDEVLNVDTMKLEEKRDPVDAYLVEESSQCSQKKDPLLKDKKNEASHVSKKETFSSVVSTNIHGKYDGDARKDSSSGKDVRLHWDLNTVMDEWELFPDPNNIDFPKKSSVDVSCEGLRSGETDKMEGSCPSKVEENHRPISDLNPINCLASEGVQTGGFANKQSIHEVVLEDLLDDGDVSDNSPGGHNYFARIGKLKKYKSGFESPVEDGELREPFALSWQENEDETDCVEYDLNDREAASGSNQMDSNGKLLEKVKCKRNFFPKELSTGNSSGWDLLDCNRFAKTSKETNVKLEEGGDFDSTQKFNLNASSLEEKVGSRVTRERLSIHVQGSSGSGTFGGKVPRDVQRSSGGCFQDRKVYRPDKYLERDRPYSRMHDGSQQNNHYNIYPRGGGFKPRLRSNRTPDTNDDEFAYDDQRCFRSKIYVKDGNRPFVKRRPPDDNYHNSMNNNYSTRDDNHNCRGRGRSGYYRHGFVKGNRGEFNDRMADDAAPSLNWMPRHRSTTRQCSTSGYNRDNSFALRKSRSRSRTRSPVPWHLQRERNSGQRQNNRSPNFRSEDRMGRNGMNYNSKFSKNTNLRLSPPRRHFFNDRNNGPNRLRERTSPGRFFGQRPRFCSDGTNGRMKSDDGGFRPRLNSERFSEQSGGGCRGYNNNNKNNINSNGYDGNDGNDSERTRSRNKHEMICRFRHSDTGGFARRFRSDEDDRLKGNNISEEYSNNNNICIKSTEKSDALMKSCEEARKYDGDLTNDICSKLPGAGDSENDAKIS